MLVALAVTICSSAQPSTSALLRRALGMQTAVLRMAFSARFSVGRWRLIHRPILLPSSPPLFHKKISTPIVLSRGFFTFRGHNKTAFNTACYGIGISLAMLGLSFAFVPFYKWICESTSFDGTTQVATDLEKITKMEKVKDRPIRVHFNADVPSSMQWHFKPLQTEIVVYPGETALAFYTAKNPTDRPIVGISTYNMTPIQAAYYFNKIQCFCFDEQILNPGEEVDLPVFFYIDPDFVNDPQLEYMNDVLLSYTFFESNSDLVLPSPFDPNNRPLNEKRQSDMRMSGESTAPPPAPPLIPSAKLAA